MPYLVTAILLVAALAVVNAWLTVTLGRRLRNLDERFTATVGDAGGRVHPVGRPVGEFSAVTVDGRAVSRDSLSGWTLVGVLDVECPPCHRRLPEFVAGARAMGGPEHVLAVVTTAGEGPAALVEQLAPVARVVVEPAPGAVTAALGVEGFPTFLLVDPTGVAAFGGHAEDLAALPAAAPA